MISHHNVRLVLVRAVGVLLARAVGALQKSVPDCPLVEELVVHVQETPLQEGQVRHWVPAFGDPVSVGRLDVGLEPG